MSYTLSYICIRHSIYYHVYIIVYTPYLRHLDWYLVLTDTQPHTYDATWCHIRPSQFTILPHSLTTKRVNHPRVNHLQVNHQWVNHPRVNPSKTHPDHGCGLHHLVHEGRHALELWVISPDTSQDGVNQRQLGCVTRHEASYLRQERHHAHRTDERALAAHVGSRHDVLRSRACQHNTTRHSLCQGGTTSDKRKYIIQLFCNNFWSEKVNTILYWLKCVF